MSVSFVLVTPPPHVLRSITSTAIFYAHKNTHNQNNHMTRPSLDRSEEQRHRERDNKEWSHHNFAPLINHFHAPVRDPSYLQGLIDQHLPFAIVSLRLVGKECLIIDAEYLTSV